MSHSNWHSIDSVTAQQAIQAASEKAIEVGIPMSIVIYDVAGHEKAMLRMDGASLISLQIAHDKAYTAAATGLPTHLWHDYIKDDPPLLTGIVHTPRFVVFGGGFPIKEGGEAIGAIGVSGGHYEQDMECARAALAALGTVEALE